MDRGKSRAVWPFLLILAGLFVLVVTMPPRWGRMARDRTADQSLSRAWQDLSISPSRSRDSSSPGSSPWLPVAASPKVAARPSSDPISEIILPGLPPKPDDAMFDGPTIDPKDLSPAMNLVARRATTRDPSTSDARDRRPEDFASSSGGDESAVSRAATIWCPPESLYAQLAQLTHDEPTAAWAAAALGQVHRLGQTVDDGEELAPEIFAQLRATVDQADPLAGRLADSALATRLRRAGYALRRRLDVWQRILPPTDGLLSAGPEVVLSRVRLAVADVDAAIRDSAHGRAWREYLLLDALAEATGNNDQTNPQRRMALARRVLARVAQTPLTESQSRFLASEPLDRLASELRRLAAHEPDRAALLAAVEHYEQTGQPSDARRLADECLWLGYQSEDRLQDLHRHVTMHYRNANLRVDVTEGFLNRLMPERLPELEMVRDTVLGNPVRGKSLTATEVGIRLIPDPNRLRLALEITGEVAALTSSNRGAASFQNTSESHYTARKPMELDVDGLTLWPAEVEQVSNVTRLRRLRTAFDGVPLVGSLIQNVARTQHDMKRSEVRREIEQKVAARAKRRIDDEANTRLTAFSERLEQRVIEPMHDLALGPRMIEAQTTEDHLTMRLRVASARQLGSHTPRPKTPEDSLASFEVHQTAMNNLVEQLGLGGRTFTLPELRARLAERLHWPQLEERSTEHDDVTITFAKADPIRVTCAQGRMTIDLAITELRKSPRVWRDFQVRVHYRPQVEGLSVELARDGVIQLPGRRVRTSAQIPLRGIFSKLFSRNQNRQLVPDRIRDNPKMSDVAVTQMTIEDGWIALALGPKPRLAQAAAKGPK